MPTDISKQTIPEERHVIIALIAQHLGMSAELTFPEREVAADVITPPPSLTHTHSLLLILQPRLFASLLSLYGFG